MKKRLNIVLYANVCAWMKLQVPYNKTAAPKTYLLYAESFFLNLMFTACNQAKKLTTAIVMTQITIFTLPSILIYPSDC